MEETKQEKIPLGFTSKNDVNALVTMAQLFDLLRIIETLSNWGMFVKQENFNADNIRYYFQEDLVPVTDEQGNPVMIKNQKGEEVPQQQLRKDFWN